MDRTLRLCEQRAINDNSFNEYLAALLRSGLSWPIDIGRMWRLIVIRPRFNRLMVPSMAPSDRHFECMFPTYILPSGLEYSTRKFCGHAHKTKRAAKQCAKRFIYTRHWRRLKSLLDRGEPITRSHLSVNHIFTEGYTNGTFRR